jgi:hypothetical protein
VERQVKVLIKNLNIFLLFPSKEFPPISFKKFVCLLCHWSPPHTHTVCTVHTVHTEQKLKREQQNSPTGTRQTDSKNLVWFGEIERNLAKLSKTTFAYRSSSYLFYAENLPAHSEEGRGRTQRPCSFSFQPCLNPNNPTSYFVMVHWGTLCNMYGQRSMQWRPTVPDRNKFFHSFLMYILSWWSWNTFLHFSVIWIVMTDKRMRSVTNYFIGRLSLF